MKVSVVIVAGGLGTRMESSVAKQYLPVCGKPILAHTIRAFDTCKDVDEIIISVPEADMRYCDEKIVAPLYRNRLGHNKPDRNKKNSKKKILLVRGGEQRQDSVYNGLCAIRGKKDDIVLIHDGVRPFISADNIAACISHAKLSGACILAIAAFDTLKKSNDFKNIESTLPRKNIYLAQTPQAFSYDIIMRAHEKARKDGFLGTDDASLVERMQIPIKIIDGSRFNIKITNREDLFLAESIMKSIV
ncbi:2-C-methyl-D-erythritol 4-phosphate cytidylyltransferase [Desulfobacterales bacterium HSG16]|nr:2-C-methyl-D-erythritol 4-phosphate cytidylyltransferase [Desulfobacterales bacterium HSG16]